MIVFLNGRFVPEEQAVVSVFDRSFMYGDGLFEAIRICQGKPFRRGQHLDRLERGADFLRIRMPFTAGELAAFSDELIARNELREAILRLHLSRGSGVRGYSPQGAERPIVVMSLHPAAAPGEKPDQWRLITSSLRLPADDPLASFKTCNKLRQVLARAEAQEAGADEALLLNTSGELAEATSSNLFWIKDGSVQTTPLASGALPGVTRAVLLDLCHKTGMPVCERSGTIELLRESEGAFLSLTTRGIVEVTELDGLALSRSPLAQRIHQVYCQTLLGETE
jgi:branched-chain amino acid aminotransferase